MAKDIGDHGTRNLFERVNTRERQRRHADRQRSLGRRKTTIWMTPGEYKEVKKFLKKMRGEKGDIRESGYRDEG